MSNAGCFYPRSLLGSLGMLFKYTFDFAIPPMIEFEKVGSTYLSVDQYAESAGRRRSLGGRRGGFFARELSCHRDNLTRHPLHSITLTPNPQHSIPATRGPLR